VDETKKKKMGIKKNKKRAAESGVAWTLDVALGNKLTQSIKLAKRNQK